MDLTFLKDMFILGIPVIEKIIRPILVYLFLIVGLRLAGKRELAQLNPFDLVVLLTLSNTVQNAIIGEDNTVLGGVIGATTLLVVNYLVVRFVHSNHRIEEAIEGKAEALISEGKVNQKLLDHEIIDVKELEIAAQKQGFATLTEIETALLEPDGTIAFIKKEPEPEVMRHQELLDRMETLEKEISALRGLLTGGLARNSQN